MAFAPNHTLTATMQQTQAVTSFVAYRLPRANALVLLTGALLQANAYFVIYRLAASRDYLQCFIKRRQLTTWPGAICETSYNYGGGVLSAQAAIIHKAASVSLAITRVIMESSVMCPPLLAMHHFLVSR